MVHLVLVSVYVSLVWLVLRRRICFLVLLQKASLLLQLQMVESYPALYCQPLREPSVWMWLLLQVT